MALDPTYFEYPMRRKGMDHDYYPWSNIFERKPVAWPSGKAIASWFVVSLEWFPILPEDKPLRAPGHMQTAYPDYRHYTARDYGSRVGIYRLLDAFAKVGAKASFATNAAIAERYPVLVKDIVSAGHEIIAHSTDMNGTIASGVEEAYERDLIARSLDTLEKVSGARPKGWLSIARSQSFNTPRLLKEAGLTYMCDWVNDELPYRFTTEAGDIVSVPLNHELSDRQIINVQQNSVDSYVLQMMDAYEWLRNESTKYGGRMLPMHITPYIMGLPYRIDAFEGLLRWLAEQPDHWFARGDELASVVEA